MYLQSFELLRPMVKEMYLQENTLFTLDPNVKGVKVTRIVPQHHVRTMHQHSLMLLHPMVKEKMHLQENTLFDLDLGIKVTRNVAQFLRHHVTYAPAKFDVALSHG